MFLSHDEFHGSEKSEERRFKMKFKLHGMVFSLLFALGLVFSFSIWGAATGATVRAQQRKM